MDVMAPKARTGPAWANDEPSSSSESKKKGRGNVQEEEEEVPEGADDMEWMRSRMKASIDSPSKAFEQDDDAASPTE